MGTLYVVGTPIGNLEDITLRALRVLRQVSLIAAEDTRKTARLLARYDIHTPLTSYFEHNKLAKLDTLLARLAQSDVALVSEAGMPGLSDPGYELVRAALQAGIPVSPVPGPCAAVTALVVSGLPTDSFLYLGFLPRKSSERRRALEDARGERRTLVLYEAPHRLLECLADIEAVLGDRPIAVARELTKLHEELYRGTVSQARQHFAGEVRGEITLVIGGAAEEALAWDETRVRARLAELLAQGLGRKEAAQQAAAESGWPRRQVYKLDIGDLMQEETE
jgi:16S rRNA (cytidine1402-2'-O)-methyltransferase